MQEEITLITGNKDKIAEVQIIMPYIQAKKFDLPEIQSLDMREIVAHKIQQALALCSAPIIVEDTAFYLDCLKNQDGSPGLPGPFIKWFLHTIGNRELFEIARLKKCTRGVAKTVVGYAPDAHSIHFFEGKVHGDVVLPEGEFGFGWSAVFKVDGCDVALNHMLIEDRVKVNQRGIAIQQLKDFLKK
mgnify:CR=1 FL=1